MRLRFSVVDGPCRPCREKVARTPEVFPGHKVLRKLGEGGMGTVYLAMTLRTQELVAVKTLRPEVAQDPVSVNDLEELLRLTPDSHLARDATELQELRRQRR